MKHTDIIIQQSTIDKLNRLAYQAQNDIKGFKMVLSLAIYDDLIQWAEEYEDLEAINFFKSRIEKMIAKCPNCFVIPNQIKYNETVYTNVNLPQSLKDWTNVQNFKLFVGEDCDITIKLLLTDEEVNYETIDNISDDFLEAYPNGTT